MPRTKKITNNKKINKNIYNNGLLNMNVIIKYLRSYNIADYKYYNNILIYKHKNLTITIHIKEFDTTDKIINMINLEINKSFNN